MNGRGMVGDGREERGVKLFGLRVVVWSVS